MTPKELQMAGQAIYGEVWKEALANELLVNERTFRRWAGGRAYIPERIRSELLVLLESRRASIGPCSRRDQIDAAIARLTAG